MHYLESLAIRLGHVLAHYGGWGLFAVNFLDSSFLAFPVVNDLLLIHLASRQPSLGLIYAVACTTGSVLGSFVIYGLSRGGSKVLRRDSSSGSATRAKRWLERNDFVTVLVTSLLPPPTPFKVVPIVAGAIQVKVMRFGAALVLGRGLRFAAEALVGMRYGAKAETYLKYHIALLSLATAALVVVITVAYRRFAKGAQQLESNP